MCANSPKHSKSLPAAVPVAARIKPKESQLDEIRAGGEEVSHEKVVKWLESWSKPGELKAPR